MKTDSARNVWIVDDDPMATFYIKRLCELTEMVDTITVFNGVRTSIEALTANAESSELLPDIIYLDIYMPVLTGWDFLIRYNAIKDQLSKPPEIYIISSSIHSSDSVKANQEPNVKKYLTKPLTIDTITETLEDFVGV
jgi:CheY-like chemotaxis protein